MAQLISRRLIHLRNYLRKSPPKLREHFQKRSIHHCLNCCTKQSFLKKFYDRPARFLSTQLPDDSDDEHAQFYGDYEKPAVEVDWVYLTNPDNIEEIRQNIINRKADGDIDNVHKLLEVLRHVGSLKKEEKIVSESEGWTPNEEEDPVDFYHRKRDDLSDIERELFDAILKIPNRTHPDVPTDPNCPGRIISTIGDIKAFSFQPRTVVELGEHHGMLRMNETNLTTGPQTYFLVGPLALMEEALIRYTVDILKSKGFRLMSVPDLIYPEIIEGCGFPTTGERNQVYRLIPEHHGDVCLSGTGEMPLAGFCTNHGFAWEELPQKLMTVSRCFRAETSNVAHEKGLYRVHQFTKVEMFAVTAQERGTESDYMMDHFLDVQKNIFSQLEIPLRILDMAAHELGAPAYRKYDIEAWMPAKGFWGEISSTSNCLDYQSRRLDTRYWNKAGKHSHCHTVNGTACAVPRMIMAILENHQHEDKSIDIPEVLQPYMDGLKLISGDKKIIMKPIKFTNTVKKNMKDNYH